MATTANPSGNNPQIVGNAFVQQYYHILHNYPEEAFKFYHEASVLSRPGPDGFMTSVTAMKAINDKILSFDHQNYKVKIYSADSQLFSLNGGVIVLVNGCLTGKDNVSRKFTQVFFLVPQNEGSSYYVLNDLFRYMDNDVDERVVTTAPLTTQNPEPTHAPNQAVLNHTITLDKDTNDDKEVTETTSSKIQEANDAKEVTKTASSEIQEDTPKKTYASIVHALKENTTPFMGRVLPPKPKLVEPKTTPRTTSAASITTPKTASPIVEVHTIFVANLPMDATPELLVGIFKQFGVIKPNGVRVRSKTKGNCFGFVEFEHASSVEGALKASPIIIGNQKARIARKRANNDSERYPTIQREKRVRKAG